MATTFTTDQILALAPDPASAKAGQGLSSPRKWMTLGQNDHAAWGKCQGSGKDPYQTQIDLSEPAFRCSCPSRKFPCKHGLGLFLLLANQPDVFTDSQQPDWVTEWLESRAKSSEKQTEKLAKKAETTKKTIADPAAQVRRASDREAKVAAGFAELALRLRDLVRNGLASAQNHPANFWDNVAARMVDAQAPGVARLVRDLATLPPTGQGWQEKLLARASKLFLLIEGFSRLNTLPPETQADIRTVTGWAYSQDELLSQDGIRDRWAVLGQRVEDEDRLRVQFSWLQGYETQRHALLLHFAAGNQPLDTSVVSGTVIDAELVFYLSAYPLRALVKTRNGTTSTLDPLPQGRSVSEATTQYADALAQNPWLERIPVLLTEVVPVAVTDSHWCLQDTASRTLSIHPRFSQHWELLALSGGHPTPLFGEWNGEYLLPLSVWANGRFVRFT
ncbi:MAG: SWIM zinc finger family protein [Deltaproteobacteria bacterium]|nr:SWIM zinc finger family protein [Deltaproteobacteria bacterium]